MVELYLYGLEHKYWDNWDQYCRKSQETKDQVSDMMFRELNGMSKLESTELSTLFLEDFCYADKIRES